MPAYYSVVQYVPDVVRDERINIGVLAFNETRKVAQFIQNWDRVRQFGADTMALRRTCKAIEGMGLAAIRDAMQAWQHSIQFSTRRASLLDVETLLIDVARRFLIDPEVTGPAYRTKKEITKTTRSHLESAIAAKVSRVAATSLLSTDKQIEGALEPHEFDIRAINGKPIFAANVIAYQMPRLAILRRDIDATAWAIDDVRTKNQDLPIAVIAPDDPGKNESLFERSRSTFGSLGAEVVTEREVSNWSKRMAEEVNENLPEWLQSK